MQSFTPMDNKYFHSMLVEKEKCWYVSMWLNLKHLHNQILYMSIRRELFCALNGLYFIRFPEKRIDKIKKLNSHLESVIESKDQLIKRLQQPFQGEYLKLEAQYHRYLGFWSYLTKELIWHNCQSTCKALCLFLLGRSFSNPFLDLTNTKQWR